MPRRLRETINNANNAAINANVLLNNAEQTLAAIDDVVNRIIAQGYVDLTIKPNIGLANFILLCFGKVLSEAQVEKLKEVNNTLEMDIRIKLPQEIVAQPE